MHPWQILGVNRQTPPEQVRDAYIALAKKHHPDKRKGDQHKFAVISEAYHTLRNKVQLKALITMMKIGGKDCVACKGQGATFKQKGIGSRVATTCKQCQGSGIVRKV